MACQDLTQFSSTQRRGENGNCFTALSSCYCCSVCFFYVTLTEWPLLYQEAERTEKSLSVPFHKFCRLYAFFLLTSSWTALFSQYSFHCTCQNWLTFRRSYRLLCDARHASFCWEKEMFSYVTTLSKVFLKCNVKVSYMKPECPGLISEPERHILKSIVVWSSIIVSEETLCVPFASFSLLIYIPTSLNMSSPVQCAFYSFHSICKSVDF